MRELLNLDDLQECVAASESRAVLIFKHSTRCPISSMAYREVDAYETAATDAGHVVYLVNVIESRPVSNAVAQKLNVEHQSPQLILLFDHEVVWSASHYAITQKAISEAVSALEE